MAEEPIYDDDDHENLPLERGDIITIMNGLGVQNYVIKGFNSKKKKILVVDHVKDRKKLKKGNGRKTLEITYEQFIKFGCMFLDINE